MWFQNEVLSAMILGEKESNRGMGKDECFTIYKYN